MYLYCVSFQDCGCLHGQDFTEHKGDVKELKNEVKEATEKLNEVRSIVLDIWELLLKKQTSPQHPAIIGPQSPSKTPPPLLPPLQLANSSL